MDIKKFEGSITLDYFVEGLLLARSEDTTPGHIWERCVYCPNCLFAKQCASITGELYPNKKPNCRDIVNILLGEMKIEDIE